MFALKFLGNFWWKLFGGIIFAAVWAVAGLAFSLTVVGYPLGLDCFKTAYVIWKPFGKTVRVMPLSRLLNVVWAATAGFALTTLAAAAFLLNAFTIAGLPLCKQWYKVAKLSLFPFGAVIIK